MTTNTGTDVLFVWQPGRKQKSYTYHSLLPDDAHAVLNAREPVGDLGEVILAHGSLFDGEWAVVGRHDVQSVAANEQNKTEGSLLSPKAQVLLHLTSHVNVILERFPHFPRRLIRKLGVLGSRRRGGTVTWAAAWAQS